MVIQSNLIVTVFFILAGILLIGFIIFMVVYLPRVAKKTEPRDRTKPIPEVGNNENQSETANDVVHDPSYTRLVTFGRAVSDDGFAVRFGDEWISKSQELSLIERNRLEKNLEEAQSWLGMEARKEPLTAMERGLKLTSEIVPPLVPLKTSEKHKVPLSIVEQVDDILQVLLETDPLGTQKIRLTEMPNKGVTVWIGNEYYEGINAVPDENVKQIIRQAVKKWEETSG
ncbi:MAG: hypothetical protein Q7U53_11655 [Anaerolineaceae bacterium]|nr:hypothetical protein [Anaerolineaceae bacterium]